jgi:hypothetical protein
MHAGLLAQAYDELPKNWQRTCDTRHQPPIGTLLKTKWPGAEVTFAARAPDGQQPVEDVDPPSI